MRTSSRRARTYVFTGPTLSAEAVRELMPDAVVRPPIAAGELWELDIAAGDTIAIIDGYYYQRRSIRHKELLAQLDRGVRVAGAASLGALRAAELAPWGMQGCGKILDWYLTGVIDGDDEIAVLHSPGEEGYRVQTEALVNLRHNLELAMQRGACDRPTADAVLNAAGRLPFTARRLETIVAAAANAGVAESALSPFREFLATDGEDLKRRDGIELLTALRDDRFPRPVRHAKSPISVRSSSYLAIWKTREKRHPAPEGGTVSDDEVLGLIRTCAIDYPRFHRNVALLALAAASTGIAEPADDAIDEADRRLRDTIGPDPAVPWEEYLANRHLSRSDYREAVLDRARLLQAGLPGDWIAGGGRVPDRLVAAVEDFATRLGMIYMDSGPSPEPITSPGTERLLAPDEMALPREERIGLFAGRTFRDPSGARTLVREFKLHGRYREAVRAALTVGDFNRLVQRRRPEFDRADLRSDVLRHWFALRWSANGSWQTTLLDRGFGDEAAFLAAARDVYPYDRVRPGLRNLQVSNDRPVERS